MVMSGAGKQKKKAVTGMTGSHFCRALITEISIKVELILFAGQTIYSTAQFMDF